MLHIGGNWSLGGGVDEISDSVGEREDWWGNFEKHVFGVQEEKEQLKERVKSRNSSIPQSMFYQKLDLWDDNR